MDINRASDMLRELDIYIKNDEMSVKVDFLTLYPFQPGEGFDWHAHSDYEFHYIKEGTGIVYFQHGEYPLSAGCFYITGPGVQHKQYADSSFPMIEYALKCSINIHMDFDMPGSDGEELKYIMTLLNNRNIGVVRDANDLGKLFEGAFREAYNKKPGYFSSIKNSIFNIILASARNYSVEVSTTYSIPKREMDSYRFETIKNYVRDNICKSITRKELASYICLSIRQTDRVVRSQTGVSIHSFVIGERISIVKKLLSTTRLNLSAIAEQTGFSSEYHLSSTFKRFVGIAPSQYRKK